MSKSIGGTVAALAVVLVMGGGYALAKANYHDHEAVCTVTDKDRSGSSDGGSSHYRVYTEQCGVLGNVDQWLAGKTDSADIQGRLQVGHTYRLRIVGWRQSVFSDFPNIVSVDGEVTP